MTTKTAKTKAPVKNLKPITNELHKAFTHINKTFFQSELPDVVITIQSAGGASKGILGWFVTGQIWENGTDKMFEINLTPEALNRDYLEIIQTLLHESIHLSNFLKSVKDTSRNNAYHNKKWLASAIAHGMEYLPEKPSDKIGYSAVTLTEETKKIISKWNIDKAAFTISRNDLGAEGKEKPKSKSYKWMCECGDSVRSTKVDLSFHCNECDTDFEIVN